MAAPPVVEILIEKYGVRGMFLMIAAFEFHSVAAGLIMRPISRYKSIVSSPDRQLRINQHETEDNYTPKAKENETKTIHLCDGNSNGDVLLSADAEHTQINNGNHNKHKEGTDILIVGDKFDTKSSSVGYSRTTCRSPYSHETYLSDNIQKERSYHEDMPNVSNSTLNNGVISNHTDHEYEECQNLYDVPTTTTDIKCSIRVYPNFLDDHQELPETLLDKTCGDKRVLLNTQTSNIGTTSTYSLRSSTWSIANVPMSELALCSETIDSEYCLAEGNYKHCQSKNVSSTNSAPPSADRKVNASSCMNKTRQFFSGIFSRELLGSVSMRLLLVALSTATLVQYFIAYLPTMAKQEGIDASKVPVLLAVTGGVDLASRITIGIIADMKFITAGQICAITNLILGTVFQFGKFFTTFKSLLFLAVLTGMFGGTRQILAPAITIEFMGLTRFKQALGFQAMLSTLLLAVHHPLLSAILEATGSFSYPLHYVGIALYVSSVCLLLAPVAKRFDAKKQAEDLEKI